MANKKKILFTNKHYGKWVALSADRKKILDYSDNLIELSKKNGEEAVYVKALNPDIAHAF